MSAVPPASTVPPTRATDDIDPELLAVLARVAHREYLLGPSHPSPVSIRSGRRRPVPR